MSDIGIKVKLFGLGGAGMHIVNAFDQKSGGLMECHLLDTDAKALASMQTVDSHIIGKEVCRGLGCGGDVELAKRAIDLHREAIISWLEDADVIILVAGLGGGAGSAFSLLVAELAEKTKAITLGFFVLPFSFEGARFSKGESFISELRPSLHGIFSIPNDILLQEGDSDQTALNGFEMGNRWILNSLSSLSNVLFKKGIIDQDLGSLKQLFQARGGKSLFAVTSDTDIFDLENDTIESHIESFLLNPLLHREDSPKDLDGLMIVIQGNQSLELSIIHKVASLIAENFNFKKDILISAYIDDSLINSLKISVFGKAEIDQIVNPKDLKDDLFSDDESRSEKILDKKKSPNLLKVHRSKLGKKREKELDDQKEFAFIDKEEDRGYFVDSISTLYKGINLDRPTYLRKGIKVKFK